MTRPIAISLSPNVEKDDVLLALRTLFSPAKWGDSREVELLEKEFAARFGPNFQALAVNSGRSAQYLILQALGVGRGDEVAVQAFTCTVVPNSTIWLGAKPLYIDIDQSYNMRPDDLEKKITEKTKAVVVQHTFGIPADVTAIKKIAQQNNVVLIEDCAHALGATYQNHPVGSLGDIAFFSFGRDKVLSSVFGGMILCSDPKLYDQIKALRERLAIPSQAWVVQQLLHPLAFSLILPLYNFQIGKVILVLLQKLGLLSKAVYREEKLAQQPKIFPQKMPGGLAVLARHQLKKLDRFTQHRREIAQIYFDSLRNSGLQLAPDVSGASWLRFPIQHPQARDLYRYAKRQGVLLGNWYRGVVMPAANLPAVKYRKGSCPTAEKMAAEVINLPTYPTLTLKQAEKVVKIIKERLNSPQTGAFRSPAEDKSPKEKLAIPQSPTLKKSQESDSYPRQLRNRHRGIGGTSQYLISCEMNSNYTVKEIENKKLWEDFVLAQNPQSFLQSWNWGETNQPMEDKIFRLGFFEGERIVGTCLAIKQTARRGPHLIVPGGPLIDWENELLVNFVVKTLKDLARREKVWFVRVRPELLDSPAGRDLFANLGFTSAPMHLHAENTLVLDITPDEETLLRGMRKSTRYEIRKSLKLDLQFRQTTDPRAASLLKKLQNETVARHKFVGFPEKLFKAQLETFGQDKQAAMFTCQKDGEILAAAIIIFYGDCAYYHHSGSSTKSRKIPASHFLQWQIIREAKNRGCRHYNFWGIAPTDNPKHRFAGVTTFKKGFGGERIDWLHAHDLPTSPLYRLTYLFETIRRITRSL